ncbi:MAG: TonB-dependent receptor plug domain-containing protein, partial [Vicinamibacterales bacterium]
IVVETTNGTAVANTAGDGEGMFRVTGVPEGEFVVRARSDRFDETSARVGVKTGVDPDPIRLILRVAGVSEGVRVVVDRLQIEKDESASRVTFVSSAQISTLAVRDAFDAIALMPGVDVRHAGGPLGEGSLTMYGISGQPTAPTANMVALNGVPLNNGLLPETSLNMLPFNLIDRVQMVHGPGSSAYGSNAMTGVLDFVTSRPSNAAEGRVSATLGNRWGTREGAARVGGAGSTYSWLAGGTYRETDGHLQPRDRMDFSDARKSNVAFLGDTRVGATKVSAALVYYDANEHNPDVRTPNRSPLVESERLHASVGMSHQLSPGLDVDATYIYGAFDGRSRETFDTAVYGFGQTASRPGDPTDQRAHSHGLVGRFTWNVSGSLLSGGVDTHRAETTDNLTHISTTGNTRGFFLQHRYLALNGRLSLSTGYRFDKASTYSETSHSPKFGAVWRAPGGRWLVRGTVSRAFTAPTFSQLFSTGFVRGNGNLVAQTLFLREVGGEWRPVPGLTVGASLFRVSLEHPIFPRFNAAINATQFTNVSPGSDNKGATASADYRLRAWSIGASYAYLDPGSATFHTWKHTFKAQGGYAATRWSLGVNVRNQSDGYWADGFARPADDFTVAGARLTARPVDHVTLMLTADNLTNEVYATTANIGTVAGVSTNTGIPRPGRSLTVGVEVGF